MVFMGVIESEGGTKHWPVGRFREHDEYLTKTSRYTLFILQTLKVVAQKCNIRVHDVPESFG